MSVFTRIPTMKGEDQPDDRVGQYLYTVPSGDGGFRVVSRITAEARECDLCHTRTLCLSTGGLRVCQACLSDAFSSVGAFMLAQRLGTTP